MIYYFILSLLIIINIILLVLSVITLKNSNRDYFNKENRFYKNYKKRSSNDSIKAVILIIASHLDSDRRYKSAYESWKKYMNKHKNIDCYFLELKEDLDSDLIKKGNHIYVKGKEKMTPGILDKTMIAMNSMKNDYDYFIRTNISTMWNLNKLYSFLMELPENNVHYSNSIWPEGNQSISDYGQGHNVIISKDIAEKICDMYQKYKDKSYNQWPNYKERCNNSADDPIIGYMIEHVSGIDMYGYQFSEDNKYFIQGFGDDEKDWEKQLDKHPEAYGFRVKNGKYKELYKFILKKIYNIS